MDDKTSTEKVEEVKQPEPAKAEVSTSTMKGYRYVCPACTGIAYYADSIEKTHPVSSCINCGASLGQLLTQNFIPLTEQEKDSLANQ